MRFTYVLGLTAASTLGVLLLPAQTPKADSDIVFREGLAILPVGRAGRSAVHTDAIEHQIVLGKWQPPKAGDEVKLPDGVVRKWEPIKAGDDGWFSGRALTGGYAYFSIPSKEKRVVILDASGHGMVYVNGEPRVGDPYQTGYVRLPVELKEGDNHFLFQGGRGRLRAKLVAPKGRAQLDTGDLTLPDMIIGQRLDAEGAIVVLNASAALLDQAVLRVSCNGADEVASWVGAIVPLTLRKIGFRIRAPACDKAGEVPVVVTLYANAEADTPLDTARFNLRVVTPQAPRKVTFRSNIDGSVQYYAVTPMANSTLKEGEKPALFLTLHGAGVEALGQASCYSNKTWGHVVAPTNRRPFGFDWEDWGRLDAMEVLELAEMTLNTDPRRRFLTGHSMGGHGVWHLGAMYPDTWAAIAPSAGWISMYSYAEARRPEKPDPRVEMLQRAAGTSDTLAMLKNYGQFGVYVLHGDQDDNVPVGQAREMRKQLATFHSNFVYYERPGAGHWWGNECVDWPPIFEFFARHRQPELSDVRLAEFTTVNPGLSWFRHGPVQANAQVTPLKPSTIRLTQDRNEGTLKIATENVSLLYIPWQNLKHKKRITLELDGAKFNGPVEPVFANGMFRRERDQWTADASVSIDERYLLSNGPFKDAFREKMLFVYGTKGNAEENAWAIAKARYDAEVFWYRGNGSIDMFADSMLTTELHLIRNVILYGNSTTNSAWHDLLKDCPVQVERGSLKVGERQEKGEEHACLFLRPKQLNRQTYVAAVSGTGLAGMRLTDRVPIFVSGVGIPDLLVLDASSLEKGPAGIRVAGFFGKDWSVAKGEFAWRD